MTHEVEKVWTSQAGYQCACLVVSGTHRCGYVGVPPSHPFHGVSYHEQVSVISQTHAASTTVGQKGCLIALTAGVDADDAESVRRSPDIVIDCHGGLTYSSKKAGSKYPIPSDNLWWFGFDCNHSWDGEISGSSGFHDGPARSLEYVIGQCESIAKQLDEYA